jgi:hypothetical protein
MTYVVALEQQSGKCVISKPLVNRSTGKYIYEDCPEVKKISNHPVEHNENTQRLDLECYISCTLDYRGRFSFNFPSELDATAFVGRLQNLVFLADRTRGFLAQHRFQPMYGHFEGGQPLPAPAAAAAAPAAPPPGTVSGDHLVFMNSYILSVALGNTEKYEEACDLYFTKIVSSKNTNIDIEHIKKSFVDVHDKREGLAADLKEHPSLPFQGYRDVDPLSTMDLSQPHVLLFLKLYRSLWHDYVDYVWSLPIVEQPGNLGNCLKSALTLARFLDNKEAINKMSLRLFMELQFGKIIDTVEENVAKIGEVCVPYVHFFLGDAEEVASGGTKRVYDRVMEEKETMCALWHCFIDRCFDY